MPSGSLKKFWNQHQRRVDIKMRPNRGGLKVCMLNINFSGTLESFSSFSYMQKEQRVVSQQHGWSFYGQLEFLTWTMACGQKLLSADGCPQPDSQFLAPVSKPRGLPWPMCSVGWSILWCTERWWVWFPIRVRMKKKKLRGLSTHFT